MCERRRAVAQRGQGGSPSPATPSRPPRQRTVHHSPRDRGRGRSAMHSAAPGERRSGATARRSLRCRTTPPRARRVRAGSRCRSRSASTRPRAPAIRPRSRATSPTPRAGHRAGVGLRGGCRRSAEEAARTPPGGRRSRRTRSPASGPRRRPARRRRRRRRRAPRWARRRMARSVPSRAAVTSSRQWASPQSTSRSCRAHEPEIGARADVDHTIGEVDRQRHDAVRRPFHRHGDWRAMPTRRARPRSGTLAARIGSEPVSSVSSQRPSGVRAADAADRPVSSQARPPAVDADLGAGIEIVSRPPASPATSPRRGGWQGSVMIRRGSDGGRRRRRCRRPSWCRVTGGRRRTTGAIAQRRVVTPRSQVRRTSIRSSRVSLRPSTIQSSVSGTEASTSAWRTCQPDAVATTSARLPAGPAGGGRRRRSGAAAELSEHVGVPVGPGSDEAGQSSDAIGEARRRGRRPAAPRAHPTSRSAPAPGRRDRSACDPPASGRARRDPPSFAPPVRHANGHGRCRRWPARRSSRDDRRAARHRRRSFPGRAQGRPAPRPSRLGTAVAGVDPRRDTGGAGGLWHTAADPQEQQRHARACMATCGSGRCNATPPRHGRPSSRTARRPSRGSGPTRRARRRRWSPTAGADRQRFGSRDRVRARRDRDAPARRPARASGHRRDHLHPLFTRRTRRRCRRRGVTARTRADRGVGERAIHRRLDPVGQRDVDHRAARVAHEMVMMLGEVLGELVVGVVVAVHESAVRRPPRRARRGCGRPSSAPANGRRRGSRAASSGRPPWPAPTARAPVGRVLLIGCQQLVAMPRWSRYQRSSPPCSGSAACGCGWCWCWC